ncbi:MAG: hypothetical protein K8I60_20675 [Anaerolineae bacterium]|nr:hypothetical protein [Anaerolineae bacterium]
MAKQKGSSNKVLWPVIGFILAGALGIIAYILAPVVISNVSALRIGGLSDNELRLAVAGVIFLLLGAVVVLIIAAAVPRDRNPMDKITEKDLQEQRMLRNKRHVAKRQRERNIKNQERRS